MATMTKSVLNATYIADSGATCHITDDPTRMYDIKPVTLGNGSTVTATMNGKLKLQTEGEEEPTTVTLHNIKYTPGFMLKLFSLSCAMKKGAQLCNEGMRLRVQKGNLTLTFDNCAKMQNRGILGLKMTPGHSAQMALAASILRMTGLHK